MQRETKWLVLALLAGALIRIVLLQQYVDRNPFFSHPVLDSALYMDWADAILEGQRFFKDEFHHPPGYAYFLAGCLKVFRGNPYGILLVQSLLLTLQAWMVFVCAGQLLGSRAAWGALAVFSLSGPVVFYGMKILSETLFTTLLFSSFYFLLLYSKKQGRLVLWLAGLLLGLAIETRGNALVCLVPALAAVLLIKQSRRAKMMAAVVLISGIAIPILPVLARNISVAGAWSPVSSNWGENFYFANNPTSTGAFSSAPGIGSTLTGQIRDVRKEAGRRAGRELTNRDAQRFWFSEGIRFIRTEPVRWIRLELEKVRRLFSRHEASSIYFLSLETAYFQKTLRYLFISPALLFVLFWSGVPFLRAGDSRIQVLLGYVLAQLALLLIFWPELRFLVPLFPFLSVLAGAVLFYSSRTLRLSIRSLAAAAGLVICIIANLLPQPVWGGREAWYSNVSAAFFVQNQADRAVEMANEAIHLNPEYSDAWVNLGAALAVTGNTDQALRAWEKALSLNPDDTTSMRNIAITFEKDDPDLALEWWNRALDSARKNEDSRMAKAIEKRILELKTSSQKGS